MTRHGRIRAIAALFAVLSPFIPVAAGAASLEKAERYMDEGRWDQARKQYRVVIRKGSTRERELGYLGLTRSFLLERDFEGVVRNLRDVTIPNTATGDLIHVLAYMAARATGDRDIALRHYQALWRSQRIISIQDVESHLRTLQRARIAPGSGRKIEADQLARRAAQGLPADTELPPDPVRQDLHLLAEALMSAEIHDGAARIWTALATGGPDDIGRTALLRLGQILDWRGDWDEAERILKLFVMLFPEDPRAADAIYRLGKISISLGRPESFRAHQVLTEYYPNTLYGALARIDMAWTWPTADRVRDAIQAVKRSGGLPDSILERGVGLALENPDRLESPADAQAAADVYRSTFPAGPLKGKAAARASPSK